MNSGNSEQTCTVSKLYDRDTVPLSTGHELLSRLWIGGNVAHNHSLEVLFVALKGTVLWGKDNFWPFSS